MEDYRAINRANWDERAPAHAASPDYNVAGFIDDPELLSDEVRFDPPRPADVPCLRGMHLQFLINTDEIRLCRLGARLSDLSSYSVPIESPDSLAGASGEGVAFL